MICALRHIRSNASLYNVDRSRIAVWGGSAGAHLAALVGTLEGDEPFLAEACGDPTAGHAVVLVIRFAGPLDLELLGRTGKGAIPTAERYFGATYGEHAELWSEGSPLTYVSADDPPFVLVHGTEDTAVPVGASESFAAALDAAGIEHELILVEGAGHDGRLGEFSSTTVGQFSTRFLVE